MMIQINCQYKKSWSSTLAKILSRKWNYLDPRDISESLARNLRSSLKIEGPIYDLRKFCLKLNISISFDLLSLDSILRQTVKGYEVIVNSHHNEAKQRYSIAHEIGHIELFNETGLTDAFGDEIKKNKYSEYQEVEELCEYFASELLMPKAECQKVLFNNGVSFKIIKQLLSKYKISFKATLYKVIESNIWKCAFIIWAPVDKNNNIDEIKAERFIRNINISKNTFIDTITIRKENNCPGSPYYAIKNKKESDGEIIINFLDENIKCYAQSSIIKSNPLQVATLLIFEPNAKEILYKWQMQRKSRNTVTKQGSLFKVE